MDRRGQKTNLHTNNTRSKFPVYRNVFGSWFKQPYDYRESDRGHQRNRHYKYLPTIALCLTQIINAAPAGAETVGGVSATAAPVANSSGSVTNQAIQVLQGPYITNTYGGGVQCQGPTRNFTPYVTGTASAQKPWEPYFNDPVYDISDNYGAFDADGNEIGDGIIDNPGKILFHKKTRTGQKDNYSLGIGFSMTWSTPLDKELQQQCKDAARTQIELQTQLVANKRLDFEIARLKNCGELMQRGIMFKPGTKFASVCADVLVMNKNAIQPHRHSIPSPSVSESQYSSDAVHLGAPLQTQPLHSSHEEKRSSLSPSSQSASPLSREDQQRVLQAVQKSSQRQQYSQ